MNSIASRESRVLRELGFVPAPTMSLDEVLTLLVEKTTRVMEAERSTLFLTAPDGTLVSRVLQGEDVQEIRLDPGQGIAGWSAARGIPLLVNDAPSDRRFDSSWDQRFGFSTREVICRPVFDVGGAVVGAVEVLNKRSPGGFDETDIEVLSLVANQIFLTIENFKLLQDLVRKNRDLAEVRVRQERTNKEVVLLLKLERCVAESQDLDTLCDAVLRQTRQVTGAESAMLYLHDTAGAELRWIVGEAGIMKCVRCDERTGLLEQVARSGEAVNENRCPESAIDIGIPRHAVIGSPVRQFAAFPLSSGSAQTNEICGTLAVQNKELSSGFDETDALFLSLIVDRLSTAVAQFREREARERDRRLATVGRLMAGVLHDIRSPMSVISGYAELLGRAAPGPESEDYLSRMNAAVRRITGMAEEIIAFSKGEREMLFTKVDLEPLMESFAADVRPSLQKRGISLELSLKTGGTVVIDQDKMLRVFHNLVTNAAEAMPADRGRIVIETDRGESETLFRFIDDGPGIPEKIRGVLFQSFVTHGKKQGTGLGLAVSKEIVEAHGGAIRFTTAMGHGTTFVVTIPDRIVS